MPLRPTLIRFCTLCLLIAPSISCGKDDPPQEPGNNVHNVGNNNTNDFDMAEDMPRQDMPGLDMNRQDMPGQDMNNTEPGDNANRIHAIFNAYTLPDILSTLQLPADPLTTQDIEVRTSAELSNAVSGDARRIFIRGPGHGGQATYPQFDLSNRSDIDIVMDNDATIEGSSGWRWNGPVRRLRWTGGNIHFTSSGDGLTITDAEDALFDDIRAYKDGPGGHIWLYNSGARNFRRNAMINSTLEFLTIGDGIDYALYIAAAETVVTAGDWVFANNLIIGQGPAIRLMWLGENTAIVGNYFSEFMANASLRIHHETDRMWFAHNVSVHGGGTQPNLAFQISSQGADESDIMNALRIESNRLFAHASAINSGSVYRLGDVVASNQEQATNWVLLNNIWSDPDGPSEGATFGGVNISVPFERDGDLRVGPGHPDYMTAPSRASFGASR